MGKYDDIFQKSIHDPEAFWGEAAELITWYKKWDRVLDDENPPFCRWFTGGEMNTCYNAVDRHVENSRGDNTAIIYDSPVTGQIQKISYRELVTMIREEIGPIANFKQAAVVKRLPKTRSGKILRGIMRKIAERKEYATPSTIDDPAILSEIEEALTRIGYAKA